MKTKLNTLVLALATAITINSPAFAGTVPAWLTASSNSVKTIQVGPKGVTSVVYKPSATFGSSPSVASEKRGPRKLISIDNGYQNIEI